MSGQLYEVECWRERWFYKIGSRYTGPFVTRQAAIDSAEKTIGVAHSRPQSESGGRLRWRWHSVVAAG